MTLYRKRPVTIEALQFDGTEASGVGITVWAASHGVEVKYHEHTLDEQHVVPQERDPFLTIPTLEGTMFASPGDYIIRGLKGEFYPCRSDIFAASYETLIGAAL